MQYQNMKQGIFRSRPNRFIAHVEIDGQVEICHVKNTGRCRELLQDGAVVWVQTHDDPARKTKYSLITVEKGPYLINMDSQAPNKAVEEWLPRSGLFEEITLIKREKTYGNSRFDLYVEADGRRCFMEVKGVTLENDGVVSFPDAPTERGAKHLQELGVCIRDGYEAFVVFVIQMQPVQYFTPNRERDPNFAAALKQAGENGVQILAVDCKITPDSMEIDQFVPVKQ